MTDYMLEIARDQGLQRVYASVLRTNAHMIHMFKERGFTLQPEEDSNNYYAELDLEHAMPFVAELPFQQI
jgi:ribosomal protein S18 acetylase RimI-like enzyme